jgi:hypothetical protein
LQEMVARKISEMRMMLLPELMVFMLLTLLWRPKSHIMKK